MKKIVSLFGMFFANLYADYTGNLPSRITLQNGETQSHKLTAVCGNQYCYAGLPSAFNPSAYDFSYTTNNGSSSLTILAVTPQNTINQNYSVFYVGNLHVGSNSKLSINDFHTLALQRGLQLDSNATLEVVLQKGQKIQASEFGPSSKIIFARNAGIALESGALFHASNMDFFILDSKGYIAQGATMRIESSTIRVQHVLENHGTLELSGSVWNVGQSGNVIHLATSSFTNKEGNIKVNGDFYNGGAPTADKTSNPLWQSDAPSPGGGNLTSYGGTIHITGKLQNQSGTELSQTQHSTIQIYGGTLKVDGGVTNDSNNTLFFGAYNGQMGKLEGNLTNNGKVLVDISGAGIGNHNLITGTISGNNNFEVIFRNGANEFVGANMQNGTLQITQDSAKIAAFESTLSQNERSILHAFDSALHGIYTYGGSALLRSAAGNTESGMQSSLFSTPYAMLDSLTNYHVAFSDEGTLGISAFGNGILGSSVGGMGGMRAHFSKGFENHAIAGTLAYGYGSFQQDFDIYKGMQQSHGIGFSIADRIMLNQFEIDVGFYGAFGFFGTQRNIAFSGATMESKDSFAMHNMQANISFSYPIVFSNFTFKPFVGLQQGILMQNGYNNTGALDIVNSGFIDHITNALLGLYLGYELSNNSHFFTSLLYEPTLYHSKPTSTFLFQGQSLTLPTLPTLHRINTQIGANIAINANMSADFSAFYKAHIGSNHIFGVQGSFVWRF